MIGNGRSKKDDVMIVLGIFRGNEKTVDLTMIATMNGGNAIMVITSLLW